MALNVKKLVFGVYKGNLLGHIILKDGIRVEPKRIEIIKKIPLSKDKEQVK